jgi:superkiller protein 3
LVHLFPPKYFEQASVLIDEVLAFSPENILCLMGRAYIYQANGEWSDAEPLFCHIIQLLPDDLDIGLRAREERAWCQCQMNDFDNGLSGLQSVIISLNHIYGRDSDVSRCLWRLGSSHWRLGGMYTLLYDLRSDILTLPLTGDEREAAYKFFIAALKHDPAFAPAFSSLGTYYLECACPPDPIRASKCFQKAFELDPRESMAAKRLAGGFSDDGEWELVEVIAKRAIEGEGGLDAGFKEGASGALPKNSWAWAAVGVVELVSVIHLDIFQNLADHYQHKKNYPAAIGAFQTALRAEPDNQLIWLRLGESYGKAGRLAAAVKALGRASALDSSDWNCSYLIGDIERRMSHFQNAIDIFKSILDSHPSEVGVLFSLSQAYLDLGQTESSSGFRLRSEESITAAIQIALALIKGSSGFRSVAWKVITDAAFLLSDSPSFVDEGSVRLLFQDAHNLFLDGCSQLAGLVNKRNLQDDMPVNGVAALEVAIFASASRLSICASDQLSCGSAWYDLGISLYSWTIYPRHAADASRIQARAVECLTSALQDDPENEVYWNALGIAQFLLRPMIAQHAYIKALDINSKRASTWVNLGLLCVQYGDFELATKSLHRAQVLDPECTLAWLGQALTAKANGDNVAARALLEHACSLSATLVS